MIELKKKEKRKKKKYLEWDLTEEIKSCEYQFELLKKMNENKEDKYVKILKKNIEIKQNSYKYQDKNKNKYDETKFITYDEIIGMLIESELKCFYCSMLVSVLYDVAFENNQWTLDRIDNEYGHNRDNVIICCLKCNLERRIINKDKYNYTKKMVIIKCE
uniref:Uncharacterized protein n=1 Tax=viral metagenome TaxID=1070528 RepID=A0A6C0H6R7_9ZZZZ